MIVRKAGKADDAFPERLREAEPQLTQYEFPTRGNVSIDKGRCVKIYQNNPGTVAVFKEIRLGLNGR
jgi:hypothetical protein